MAKIRTNSNLTFDDVLIRPSYSEIDSRRQINTAQSFLGHFLSYPILSANMDYVTGPDMAIAMDKAGGLGILHRFVEWEQQKKNILEVYEHTAAKIAFSIGVKEEDYPFERVKWIGSTFDPVTPTIVCIDVAHGHHKKVIDLVRRIKDGYPKIKIIAGNVATAEGTVDLIEAGADAIKVGIGPGSVCTTRIVTGVGIPQLSAILECSEQARRYNRPIIADGGIRNSGDIVKALAAGADVVMLGNLLAGATEAPGEPISTGTGRRLKPYRGQSIFGSNDTLYTKEGVSGFVEEKGPVKDILHQLIGGIRSGMSYVGANNLKELRENAEFVKVSSNTVSENHPRVREAI